MTQVSNELAFIQKRKSDVRYDTLGGASIYGVAPLIFWGPNFFKDCLPSFSDFVNFFFINVGCLMFLNF